MQAAPADAASDRNQYTLVHGCFTLSSGPVSAAGPFRMQATDLGTYLLYTANRRFLGQSGGGVANAGSPSPATEWKVRPVSGGFTLANRGSGDLLTAAAGGLTVGGSGAATVFSFDRAGGCPEYPEVNVSAVGKPLTSSPKYGETRGIADAHMHHMAFEAFGGGAHCGRPWHRYGVTHALVDCIDHQPRGCAAVLETAVGGDPCHDPAGWPDFTDWPAPHSLTHEQTYYKWLERAWMAGLRVFVQLSVENRVLCDIYPTRRYDCNGEMPSILRQIRDTYKLQDYVDAQSGGPGKGWYRVVRNPFQARKVINSGKLAVILGMETSEPFECRVIRGRPQCDAREITDWIERLHRLGVRQMELTNKFDNALTGVAGDGGTFGIFVNGGNFISTGRYWDLDTCDDEHNHDKTPGGAVVAPHNDDELLANALDHFFGALPPGAAPIYPEGPHCNRSALTNLGAHALKEMMRMRMLFDPDHMSVYARRQALNLIQARRYPGVLSSHSWSTDEAYRRIARMDGFIAPYAGDSEGFVDKWIDARRRRGGRQYWGIGYGADQNGLGSQGDPRGADVPNPVVYPFRSFDGGVKFRRQRSGNRIFDINVDGVSHYGMYADWLEDLRILAGRRIIRDLSRGPEAYLQMWERATGIERVRCRAWFGELFSPRGIGELIRIGDNPIQVLKRAGQPVRRTRAWKWCTRNAKPDKRSVGGRRNVVAVFDRRTKKVGLVLSSIQRHQAGGVIRSTRVKRLPASTRRFGNGILVRDAGPRRTWVYGARGGRVRFVGVASDKIARNPVSLRRHLKLSGLG